jgi:hypothetical protein
MLLARNGNFFLQNSCASGMENFVWPSFSAKEGKEYNLRKETGSPSG